MRFIDGDFYENMCDVKYTNDIKNTNLINQMLSGSTQELVYIYTQTHNINNLLTDLNSKTKVVIIAHNSDHTFSNIEGIKDNVKKIWMQNYNGIQYDIIEPLPIGIERQRWSGGQKHKTIDRLSKSNVSKNKTIYSCFSKQTNKERSLWKSHLRNVESTKTDVNVCFNTYINNVNNSMFITSPEGNGIDCHRTYEALYLNTVPIIKKSNFTNRLFSETNAIIIDDIRDVKNINSLIYNQNNEKMNNILSQEYWLKKIKSI